MACHFEVCTRSISGFQQENHMASSRATPTKLPFQGGTNMLCMIAILQTPEVTHFLCSKCHRWYCFSGTIGNLNHHIEHMHKDLLQGAVTEISADDRKKLFKKFILTTGISFSTVEHPIIQKLFPGIGSRKDISALCTVTAHAVCKAIQARLAEDTYLTVTTGEWTDEANNKYIGIQIQDGTVHIRC